MSSEQVKDAKLMEKAVDEFQQLRNEQRNLINNLNTLEMDLKEHKTVIDTLKTVDPDRKCFRLIGGVLCERTVRAVLPQLIENKDFIEKTITKVTEDLTKKGQQINKYKEEHNIKIRGEPVAGEQKSQQREEKKSENRNVLVSN
ncbi:probable prefoldin subunit 2 [Glossina fuscipes]|uniref:Prefoldin subunit 2 n=5 Tax=Glossina TaxID=7393 RepID=A0A1B0B9A7_9MUSC|nr:probable prefoldin subunit 2 [Glossina fuscipes]